MMKLFRIAPMALALTVSLGAATLPVSPARADGGTSSEIRVRINLTGAAINGVAPRGYSEFRKSSDFRAFKVQVEQVNRPDRTTLNVAVNGSFVGMISLSLGRGELQRSTKDGQMVPQIKAGDIVTVTDSSAKLILSGKF